MIDLHLNIMSTSQRLISSMARLTTSLTNTYESMKLMAGCPTVMLPDDMFKKLERARYPPKSRNRPQDRPRRVTMEELYNPRYDMTEIPLYKVWSTEANTEVKCLMTHRDQICYELLIYEKGEKMEDILSSMSQQDEEGIRNIMEVQKEGEMKQFHESSSRRVYDLFSWAKKTNKTSSTARFPEDSSPEKYSHVMSDLMTNRFTNTRNSLPYKAHLLPWDIKVDSDFCWDAQSTVSDWARFTCRYPELEHVVMTPTMYTSYQRLCAVNLNNLSNLSLRSSPPLLERPSFWTPSPSTPSPMYGINPDRQPTPPNNCNKRINFNNTRPIPE